MSGTIILIIGLLLGGFAGTLIGWVLGVDYEHSKDAPAPDIFNDRSK